MKKQCYFYEEESEDLEESVENIETFECEMGYVECNRRGYCNGDC